MRRLTRKLRWDVVAGAVVVLMAVVGTVVWDQFHFEARRVSVPEAPLDLLVQPGVSEAELAAVQEGLRAADHYLRTTMNAGVRDRVEVRLAYSDGCEPFTSPAGPPTGWAQARLLCLNTKAPAWRSQFAQDPVLVSGLAAHEHVHNAQAQLGCLADRDEHEWLWLFEGMAEHLSFQALTAAGSWADEKTVPLMLDWGAADPDLEPLEAFENDGAGIGDAAYGLFTIATRYLDEQAPRESAMMDFCRSVGNGQAWHGAFQQAFGLSVEDFYLRFAEARPQLTR